MRRTLQLGQFPALLRGESGVALPIVFILLIAVFIVVGALSMESWTENQFVERQENQTKALYAAESGIATGENFVWNQFLVAQGGNSAPIPTYLNYLNGIGLPNDAVLAAPQNVLISLDGMTNINAVSLAREDSATGGATTITIAATGADRYGNPQNVREVLRIQPEVNQATKYGVLAKDLACIFCHTNIDNAERFYNRDASKFGTYDRVRVGALDVSIIQEEDQNNGQQSYDTRIAGTLYTRGNIINRDNGAAMTQGEITASTIDGYQFDPATGYIQEDAMGNMTQLDLSQAQQQNGEFESGANLYMDYPTDESLQTDGALPDKIEAVFYDANGDRLVDANEVQDLWTEVGDRYDVNNYGTLSGGTIGTVDLGDTVANAYGLGSIDASTGVHQGNLLLEGTVNDPLLLDKTIIVQGDVVIQGTIKGSGAIYASGNIYVTGDLTYFDGVDANGDRTYGIAQDGSKNALMLNAGGNVMINDFLTPEYQGAAQADDVTYIDYGDHLDPTVVAMDGVDPNYNSGFSFTMEQMAFYNRNEWTKTQQELPNQVGNMMPNSTYDAAYVPRYLTMGAGDPVYIYGNRLRGQGNSWTGTYWDDNDGLWQGDSRPEGYIVHEDTNMNGVMDPGEDLDGDNQLDEGTLIRMTQAQAAAQGASIVQMSANDAWISDQQLKQLWINDNNNRLPGTPLTLEGGVQTDGTIFMMARDRSRYGRRYAGSALINGALIGNNIGMLTPADFNAGVTLGLQMNYDQRLTMFATSTVGEPVEITRESLEYL